MQDYVAENLGQRFIEPQTADLHLVFKDSSPTTPLIFVLSTGTDPAADLYKFADEMRFSKKLSAISLGQGQVWDLLLSQTMFYIATIIGICLQSHKTYTITLLILVILLHKNI